MKPYSIDFREKIVKTYEQGKTSVRKVAERFNVSKAFVQKMLKQQKLKGHLQPGKQGGATAIPNSTLYGRFSVSY